MEGPVYKPFHETYRIVAFLLIIGFMYPNPATEKRRFILICFLILSGIAFPSLMLVDMYRLWTMGEIVDIVRRSTILGPFTLICFKTVLMFYKRVQAKELIDEINRDHASFNNFNEEYQTLFNAGIRNGRIYCERMWGCTLFTGVTIFSVMATFLNIYKYTLQVGPTRYMIHDLNNPFAEPEARFESPFYEIIFIYTMYTEVFDIINFIGYDGFYGLCVNHACIKIEMIWKLLENALKAEDQHMRLVEVIKEQQRLFRFVDLIRDTFNIWLGIIYMGTMIHICTCLFYIVEGHGFDIRYGIFIVVATIHIYLPCRYASKLKAMSLEMSTVIYSSGWENVTDLSTRKMFVFMIARAQTPLDITVFKIIPFDMELFMRIMQTSYSMYTLLRTTS